MVGVQRAFVFLSELDFKSDIQSFRVMWQLLKNKHQGDWSKCKWILKRSFFLDTLYIITCKQITKKTKNKHFKSSTWFFRSSTLALGKAWASRKQDARLSGFHSRILANMHKQTKFTSICFFWIYQGKNRSLYKHCTFCQLENSVCHSENYFQFQFGLRSTDCFTHLQNWIRPSA